MPIHRRAALRVTLAAALIAAASLGSHVALAQGADADPLSRDAVLNDAAIPAAGNPAGDITIVEYSDYQCPYCKKVHPVLAKLAKDDGKIRLVFKNWPIFGPVSINAARLAMAAQYQGKYGEAHDALMAATGKLTDARVPELLAQAGIDTARLDADFKANATVIDDALKRNGAQAQAFGFQGTPAFIVGTFRIPGALDEAGFKQAVADARALAKK
jgi:protein-disulfide isomerase